MYYLCIEFKTKRKISGIAIKPKNYLIMKIDVHTLKQQTQDFVLRLFVDSGGGSTLSSSDYCICSHVGTHARLHQ